MTKKAWDLIREGSPEDGIDWMEARGQATLSHVMELGVAYLWLRNYSAAWSHFRSAIGRYPAGVAPLYEMAGVASWCLNEHADAVAQWQSGLDCGYADGAGGVKLPMLLFSTSILSPEALPYNEAAEILRCRTESRRITNWPGPIVNYLLGMSAEDLRRECIHNSEEVTRINRWQTGFYIGVMRKKEGDLPGFEKGIRDTSTVSNEDFDINRRDYLTKLWNGELFIARHINDTWLL